MTLIYRPSIKEIETVSRDRGFWFPDKNGPKGDVFIFGTRDLSNLTGNRLTFDDSFNDVIGIVWPEMGDYNIIAFPGTTNPGRTYLFDKFGNDVDATGYLKPGQYRGFWAIGTHRGKARLRNFSMIQVGEGDMERDKTLDGLHQIHYLQRGLFGVNAHPGMFDTITVKVGPWSAACQVIASWWDYVIWMNTILAAERHYWVRFRGRKFGQGRYSYTLFDRGWLKA
jgi:hypothetical protein